MNRAVERVKGAFGHQDQDCLIRGELWLGKTPFQEARLDDDLKGHLKLRSRLGMDLLFLPLLMPYLPPAIMDYRRFSLVEVGEAVETSDLFVSVIVDGPFQKLTEKKGLLPLLTELKENEPVVAQSLNEEAAVVLDIITECIRLKVGAVVIADDLAHQHSTYISPVYSRRLLTPFYSKAVARIHDASAYALFHSCGNITGLLPQLVACGFDGLAACQSQCLDLITLKKEYGSQLTFLAGIDADLLETESLTGSQKKEFGRRVMSLAQGGGFILGSSCGLYSRNSLQRLRELYGIAEEYFSKNNI